MRNFTEFMLNMFIVYLGLEVMGNCKKTKNFIKAEIFIVQTTEMGSLMPALRLK